MGSKPEIENERRCERQSIFVLMFIVQSLIALIASHSQRLPFISIDSRQLFVFPDFLSFHPSSRRRRLQLLVAPAPFRLSEDDPPLWIDHAFAVRAFLRQRTLTFPHRRLSRLPVEARARRGATGSHSTRSFFVYRLFCRQSEFLQ